MSNDDLDEEFQKVKQSNLARAAAKLGVDKVAVSKQIQDTAHMKGLYPVL